MILIIELTVYWVRFKWERFGLGLSMKSTHRVNKQWCYNVKVTGSICLKHITELYGQYNRKLGIYWMYVVAFYPQ